MLANPEWTVKIIAYVFGSLIGILGIIGIIKFFIRKDETKYSRYGLAYGLICVVVSCLLFFRASEIAKIITFLLGAFIIINSVTKIEFTFKIKKGINKNWVISLILLLLSFGVGLLLIFNPLKEIMELTHVIGIMIIFYSILDILQSFLIKYNVVEVEHSVVVVEDKKE